MIPMELGLSGAGTSLAYTEYHEDVEAAMTRTTLTVALAIAAPDPSFTVPVRFAALAARGRQTPKARTTILRTDIPTTIRNRRCYYQR